MRKTIELSPDVKQDTPIAWLVLRDGRPDKILTHWRDAVRYALDLLVVCGGGTPLIYPLWAGLGQPVEEDAT